MIDVTITNNNLPTLEKLDQIMREELDAAMRRICQETRDIAVLHIQSQDLSWKALSDYWTKYKAKHNYSSNIYIMTATYMNSITWQYDKKTMTGQVGVFKATAGHLAHGEELWKIAEALEYGTIDVGGFIPPRPLWAPTWEQKKRSAQTLVGLAIKRAAKRLEAMMPGGSNA
jgi:hypothetical protein